MSFLETERSKFEELEVIEDAIASRLQRNPGLFTGSTSSIDHGYLKTSRKRPLKEILIQRNEIEIFVKRYKKICGEVLINNSKLNDELEAFRKNNNNFKNFDKTIRKINEKNEHHEITRTSLKELYNMGGASVKDEKEEWVKKTILSKVAADFKIDKIFNIEEQYGTFINLTEYYKLWLNLPGLKEENRLNYLQYLNNFHKIGLKYPSSIDRYSLEYFTYLEKLSNYLIDFLKKTQILSGPERTIEKILNDFPKEWELLKKISNINELFCESCNKSFAKESVYKGHLTGKKHLKNFQKSIPNNNKEISKKEFLIKSLAELLEKQIKDTRLNIERKQGLTNKERMEEMNELLNEIDNDDFPINLEEEIKEKELKSDTNPQNLPLDIDGNPIPFWLWKLQGLGHEFSCEICGNIKFNGRKLFDKHFLEPRHVNGLKCLGIQISNSDLLLSFKGVVQIDEAVGLWKKLKKELRKKEVILESKNIIEVEDEDGNVMTEKIYEDLKKQGLL